MSAAAIRALAGQLAIIDCIWLSLIRCIGSCADTGAAKVASAKVTVAILIARDDKVISFLSIFEPQSWYPTHKPYLGY
jgi:hypothetical protein